MSDRLRSVLPDEAAAQVLQEADTARTRKLPAGALEQRALDLAAKGTPPADIVRDIAAQHQALWIGRETLRAAGWLEPTDDEIEAAAAVLRKGLSAAAVRALVRVAPAGRPLAAPLGVVANLIDRGLPADDVVAAMRVWLEGNASDAELYDLAGPPQRAELTVIRTRPARRPGTGAP